MAGKITDYSAIGAVDRAADLIEIVDLSLDTSYKVTPNNLLGITGNPVGHTDTQTLTNKTLGNTNTVILKDTLFTLQDDGDATKQVQFQLSGITTGTTRTLIVPDASSTLVNLSSTQTLTNKTLTSATLTTPTINNPTLNTNTVNEFTAANGVTVSGLNIKSGALNTNNSVVAANITAGAVQPQHLTSGTGSGWAWSTWVPTFTNFSLGNGVLTAKYGQTGKTVNGRMHIVLGTTSAMSGDFQFTLPVTATALPGGANLDVIGMGNIYDAAASINLVQVSLNSTTKGTIRGFLASGTYVGFSLFTATVPFIWATSMEIAVTFTYEAA